MKTWLSEDPGLPVGETPANSRTSGVPHEAVAVEPENGQEPPAPPAALGGARQVPQAAPQAEVTALPVIAPAAPTVLKPKRKSLLRRIGGRIAANPIWRTRGLWLGGTGVALAMNAQKTLTVDGQLIPSIRWYAVAIFVMLIAWLGTYKNKSLLAEPTPLPKGRRQNAEGSKQRDVDTALKETAQQPGATMPSAPPVTTATTLPVRAKRGVTPQPVAERAGMADGAGDGHLPLQARAVHEPPLQAGVGDGEVVPQKEPRFNLPWTPGWRRLTARYPFLTRAWPRYVLVLIALGLNLYSADQLRKDYFSPVGGYGWLLSLVILAAAFVGERRKAALPSDPHAKDVEDRTRVGLPRGVEAGIILAIFMLGLGLRVFRLDDWTGAMHGDEGEFGMNVLAIVNGDRISPFMTGWFFHPNFSFFSIAGMMQVFGTGLFGLRILSALLGALMLLPFYGLVRMWFGVRMAVIAGLLLAFMDVSLYFGKLGLNNIETPFFIVTGLYFFFKGIKSLRTLDFVLSAYAFMLTLYFYFGGRLTPFLAMAIVGYMFVAMPIVRLPGAYFRVRREQPQLRPLNAFRQAALHQWRGVWQYVGRLVVFGIAAFCLASPWLVYFQDHQLEMNTRANEKLIFNPGNLGVITNQTGATTAPLYLGLRMPTQEDIYPWLPVVFEQTPTSVKLTDNGFWPRVLWTQATKTLSMFTYRKDESSFYTFTLEPGSKPIEAALLILGVAWALWRWRDTRMAVLSLWFWSTILVGGSLTIDAPYMPRLVGIVPALAIFIAIPLNKMAAELIGAFGMFGRAKRWARVRMRVGVALSGTILAVLLLYMGFQNVYDYFTRYLGSYPNREHLGTANFVRWMNDKATSEGRPKPQYFDGGLHTFYWGYGINRFLNYGTQGTDLTNATNELPILNNDDRDVVFMLWDYTSQYLPAIEAYYPGGEKADYLYGPEGSASKPFVYYRVKREQIEARRRSLANYTPTGGAAVQREEDGLGSLGAPPSGLQYPVQAEWSANIVAPSAGTYKFGIDAPLGGSLLIDGRPILTTTASATHMEAEVTLARGPHEVKLAGTLADAGQKVTLLWAAGSAALTPVPRQYLWNGPGRGLYGEVRPYAGALLNPDTSNTRILTARVDGFLGFRHSPDAIMQSQFNVTWRGILNAPRSGDYNFSVFSNGDSVVLIDGQVLVNNIQGGGPHESNAPIALTQGPHLFELRYNWTGATGFLEAMWTPPGGQRALITPDVFQTEAGILDPASLESALPPVQLKPDLPAVKVAPDAVIGTDDSLSKPKGIGVDKDGNIYVGDRGNHRVVVYSADGKKLREWGKAAPAPPQGLPPLAHQGGDFADISDVAVTQDGTVYVFDSTPRVQAFKGTGEYIGSFEPDQMGLYGPNGIAEEAPTKNGGRSPGLYIAVTGQNRILRLPSVQGVLEGKASVTENIENATGSEGDRLDQPVDSVADPSGMDILYVIDLKERLAQLKPKSGAASPTREWGVSAQWRLPIGKDDGGSRLAISGDGKYVYMSDPDRKRVAVVNLTSGDVTYFGRDGSGPGEFGRPSGIAVDPAGRIYVVDSVNNNVQVFSPDKVGK